MTATPARSAIIGAVIATMVPAVAIADSDPPPLGEVKFAFDSSALPIIAPDLLAGAVAYAREHPAARLVLDAHCDPIGTSPYNIGLAIRRAGSVRQQLTAMGVPEEQIVIAVYGEDGERRARYADDRRVTLWPTREPLATVVDRTFAGDGTAVVWEEPLTVSEIEAPPDPVATR